MKTLADLLARQPTKRGLIAVYAVAGTGVLALAAIDAYGGAQIYKGYSVTSTLEAVLAVALYTAHGGCTKAP